MNKSGYTIFFAASLVAAAGLVQAQNVQNVQQANIYVDASKPAGIINSNIYGQLFEHIYFSANNGVWQELIYGRSFEPEHYPGISPRDGYFDGWFMDNDNVLHSPTRYEQPIDIATVDGSDYEISMDINWRAYKLAARRWSGGLMDIRIAFAQDADGNPYYFRIHDPYFETTQRLRLAQTESQIAADREADARAQIQNVENVANFSIANMQQREVQGWGGRRIMRTLTPIVQTAATDGQIDQSQAWRSLRICCKDGKATAFWDGKQVVESDFTFASVNNVTLWENYTEALFRNIEIKQADGNVIFAGVPDSVKIPAIGPHWLAWGTDAQYELVKGDAVNMEYSQRITAKKQAGISHGPQFIHVGDVFKGSLYAKGKGRLTVAMVNGNDIICTQELGKVGKEWKKYEFTLEPGLSAESDAQFAILVEGGSVLVDMVTMATQEGLALGGFRPDIFKAVKELHPTCMRWPGGGYAAQYNWKWAVGPQEQRQRWPHWMWMDYDQNVFGTDEFIRFCREIDSEPVIVVSVGFDRPESEMDSIIKSARDWVAYCNEPATGEWGAKRAANGHPEPYNVKLWEIDNEMWEMGIEKYQKAVVEFSRAMKEVDPTIQILVCGGFPEDEKFIKEYGNLFDFMSLHHYEQANGYATGPVRLKTQYERYADYIANGPNPNIKLFISEWNLNSQDWRTGLFAGGFLNMCETTPVVEMGAAALFIRRTDAPDWNNAFINFDYKDLYVAPNYLVTKLWQDNFSKYRLSYTGQTGPLSISTTLSENGESVIVKIVNPTENPVELGIDGTWKDTFGEQWQEIAPGSLSVGNTLEQKDAVRVKTVDRSAVPDSGKAKSLDIAPYSAVVYTLRIH